MAKTIGLVIKETPKAENPKKETPKIEEKKVVKTEK